MGDHRAVSRKACGIVMAGAPPPSLDPERARRWSTPLYIIHAEQDELIPLAPTADMAATLAAAGAPVNIEILPGVSHFETHRFATPLRAAAPYGRNGVGKFPDDHLLRHHACLCKRSNALDTVFWRPTHSPPRASRSCSAHPEEACADQVSGGVATMPACARESICATE